MVMIVHRDGTNSALLLPLGPVQADWERVTLYRDGISLQRALITVFVKARPIVGPPFIHSCGRGGYIASRARLMSQERFRQCSVTCVV